jgi:hypothetical protein
MTQTSTHKGEETLFHTIPAVFKTSRIPKKAGFLPKNEGYLPKNENFVQPRDFSFYLIYQ